MVLAGIVATGCSSTLSDPALKGTVPSNVAKAKIISDGDEICAATDAKIAKIPEPISPDDIDPFFRQSIDALRDETRKLAALGVPDAGAEQLATALAKANKAYDELERRIPDLVKDPNIMNTDPTIQSEMADADQSLVAFGFKVCGQAGATGPGGSTPPGSVAVTTFPIAATPG